MAVIALLWLAALGGARAAADDAPVDDSAANANARQLFGAIVKVEARAVPGARSTANLGAEREGTGVIIDEQGLVLTIGYIIVEADEVKLVDSRGRSHPATVVAYDHPSGLGLVRPLTPIAAKPLPLGDPATLKERDPVMVVTHEGRAGTTLAFVVSRRPFTGNWEYALDNAIFTAPPTLQWSGAALVGPDGKLLGIGSLIVREVAPDETVPGNMFIPVDVLRGVLPDLLKQGHRAGPARPWVGINADESQGRLFVTRVSPDGPADKAGITAGDIILAVDGKGVRSQREFYDRLWATGSAGTDVPLRVLHEIDLRDVRVHSIDRTEYFTPRPTH